jgi:hypothetical protein
LEAATARVLAACPLVTDVHEQPFAIWYRWHDDSPQLTVLDAPPAKTAGETAHYSHIVPDFLVTMHSGSKRLIEVKPSSKLTRPLVQRKLAVARTFSHKRGQTFHIVTERELFRGPLLRNVRLLGRFGMVAADPQLLARIDSRVAAEPVALGVLRRQLAGEQDQAQTKAAILHLVTSGRLDLDPRTATISDETLLYPGGTIPWDPFDSVWAPSGSSTDGPSASSANSRPIASWRST